MRKECAIGAHSALGSSCTRFAFYIPVGIHVSHGERRERSYTALRGFNDVHSVQTQFRISIYNLYWFFAKFTGGLPRVSLMSEKIMSTTTSAKCRQTRQ